MKHRPLAGILSLILSALFVCQSTADDPAGLRLVPFPKQVELATGRLRLDRPMKIETPEEAQAAVQAFVADELTRAGCPEVELITGPAGIVRLSATSEPAIVPPELPAGAGNEDYSLAVTADGAVIVAADTPGLIHGIATLGQLIRANCTDHSIPALNIDDWPSIRWRAFQDDLTRGPSTKFSELKRDVTRGAMLKMNLFTYYMQHQFAFQKHPLLGPRTVP